MVSKFKSWYNYGSLSFIYTYRYRHRYLYRSIDIYGERGEREKECLLWDNVSSFLFLSLSVPLLSQALVLQR